MTGQGSQENPFVVETFDELVSVANTGTATDMVYIELGKDINIADEYPLGNMPTLEIIRANIDGKGHYLANWYRIVSRTGDNDSIKFSSVSGINNNDSIIKNIFFKNIYNSVGYFISIAAAQNTSQNTFDKCKFSGKTVNIFASGICVFNECSFKLNLSASSFTGNPKPAFNNCYIDVMTTSNSGQTVEGGNIFANGAGVINSYIIVRNNTNNGPSSAQNFGYSFSNCAIEIISENMVYNFSGVTNPRDICVVNTSKCDQEQGPFSNQFKEVDTDEYWHDAEYLANLGFNIAL